MKNPLDRNGKGKLQIKYSSTITCFAILLVMNVTPVFAQSVRPDSKMFVAETVQPGVTFYDLAEKYYGNKDFWVYIYLANKSEVPYPDDLSSGMSVVIPQAEALGIDADDPASVAKAKELSASVDRHRFTSDDDATPAYNRVRPQGGAAVSEVVRPGDTFRTLALRYYGSKDFWVYIFLANRSKVIHPNMLSSGKTLVIPAAASLGIDANSAASLAKARELGRKAMSESN